MESMRLAIVIIILRIDYFIIAKNYQAKIKVNSKSEY